MKQEKVKEEVKKETKGPMKKVDEVRPGAICKNCQGHMNHNRAGQVSLTSPPIFLQFDHLHCSLRCFCTAPSATPPATQPASACTSTSSTMSPATSGSAQTASSA